MKRVRINEGRVAIVERNGNYNRTIQKGIYWLRFSERAIVYLMDEIYKADKYFNIWMKDEHFKSLVKVIDVKDGEIVLQYIDGIFFNVITAGKYFYFNGLMNYTFQKIDLNKVEITEDVSQTVLNSAVLSNYVRNFTVASYEEGLLFIDGKFVSTVQKGTYNFWRNSISVEILKTDIRQRQLEISGQEILTKDKAALRVNFYTQYKVVDTVKALSMNKEYEKQLYILIQLALRAFVGSMTLDEMLSNKTAVAEYVMNEMKSKSEQLGVEIIDAGMRDVILTGEIKDIMNQVLIAQKQAEANTITRREETASTRSLLNTAKLMEDNSMLFKLKEMEYVEKMASKIGEITVSGGNGQVMKQLKEIFSGSTS